MRKTTPAPTTVIVNCTVRVFNLSEIAEKADGHILQGRYVQCWEIISPKIESNNTTKNVGLFYIGILCILFFN